MKWPCRVLCGVLLLAAPSSAEMPAGAVKLKGRTQITRSQGGIVRAATFKTDQGEVYQLVADEKGGDFARVMNRERAEIYGRVSTKDGTKWLEVLGYTDERMTAAHELWRRMRCNACIYGPAMANSSAPQSLGSAKAVRGRHYGLKAGITAWTRDAGNLWVATDNRILQIDLAGRKVVRSYGRQDGLPDAPVDQLLCNAKAVWIAYRGGVAALKIGGKEIADLPAMRAGFVRLCAEGDRTWVVADTGTFCLAGTDDKPVRRPALPTGERITRQVTRGLWTPIWMSQTAHYVSSAAAGGGRLLVASYGDVYAFDGASWSKLASRCWGLQAGAGRIWFLSAAGLVEYDPARAKRIDHVIPEIGEGRPTKLLLTGQAAWVAAEPAVLPGDRGTRGGGLARYDLTARQWKTWTEINGHKADRIRCLKRQDGAVWAVGLTGRYRTKSAHPGMTYVKRKLFVTEGMALHRFDAQAGSWQTAALELGELEHRLICGQDGGRGPDAIALTDVLDISAGAARVFGHVHLAPQKYFSGYWPCVDQLASRAGGGGAWRADLVHRPEQLDLQGQQPLVLDISNKGEMILKAVGHDDVLGLFNRAGVHWAVTAGCVGCLEEPAGTWRKVLTTPFRFYWRATAALEVGRWLYVGSDRGLICRMGLDTGLFEPLVFLKGRSVTRIAKDKAGRILIGGVPAPLGMLPVQLRGTVRDLDASAAAFDGKGWTPIGLAELPPAGKDAWSFRRAGKPVARDRSQGNLLVGPGGRFYVKGVFWPRFLCQSEDGRRVWLSTFTGLVRLDVGP